MKEEMGIGILYGRLAAELLEEQDREQKKNPGNTGKKHTLCWDCYHATNPEGACPWSVGFEQVPGWTAKMVNYRGYENGYKTFIVESCPLFERNAENFGLKRMEKGERK